MQKIQRIVHIALVLAIAFGTFGAMAAENETQSEVLNVNTAAASELAMLPRVGPALAQRIVEYREENGKFERPSDLLLVRGIGDKTFALMEPFVAVKGETTLARKLRVSDLQAADKADDGANNSAGDS